MKFLHTIRTQMIVVILAGVFSLTFAAGHSFAQNAGQLIFTPTGKELIQVLPPNTAAIAYVPLSSLRDGAQYVYNVPLTGFTLVMTPEQSVVSLNPAGTLAAGTITMPTTLYDGKIVTMFSTQIVTALTLNTANSSTFVPAAPTAFTALGSFSFIYDLANNQWHRFQ